VTAFCGGSPLTIPPAAESHCKFRLWKWLRLAERGKTAGERWLFFEDGCWNGKVWCNGRGKPLALRKAMVIVRKISLMAGMESNPHRHGSE